MINMGIGRRLHEGDRGFFSTFTAAELVVTAVIGVVSGVLYQLLALGSAGLGEMLKFIPQGAALVNGGWLFAGVLGALIVRKPGAALGAELLAALVEALMGSTWGPGTLYYGAAEGLAVEVGFLIWLYAASEVGPALVGGALSGLAAAGLDLTLYYPGMKASTNLEYAALSTFSGLVIAGLGSFLLVRLIRLTGVLSPFAAGREVERV